MVNILSYLTWKPSKREDSLKCAVSRVHLRARSLLTGPDNLIFKAEIHIQIQRLVIAQMGELSTSLIEKPIPLHKETFLF